VNVKVVAATNANLDAKVRDGSFRADLYARLNPAARLVLPPLRDRIGDLAELMRGFVRKKLASGPDRALLADYMESVGLRTAPHAELCIGKPDEVGHGVRFVLSRQSYAELRAHPWPGNVRELELLLANATVFALADAVGAAQQGRAGAAADTIPIPAKLVRDLLGAAWVADKEENATRLGGLDVRPRAQLRDVARDVERQLYLQLYRSCAGNFTAMARRLLEEDDPSAARKVRLRFNQLGLRVRELDGDE
jgi:DNA-binding NtrC family response regulator